MNELDQLALRATVLKALLDKVEAEYNEARKAAGELLGAEGRKNAAFDGCKLAAVSVSKAGRVSVDEPTLSLWVAEKYPTEVAVRPVVRPAFLELIKKTSQAAGMPCMPDGTLDVPGVTVGDPYCSVRLVPGGREVIEQLWRAGRIDLDTGSIKEIEK